MVGKNIYELAGPRIITYKDFYKHISECLNKTRVLTPVPLNILKPLINIAEKTPFSQNNVALEREQHLLDWWSEF